MAGKVRKKPRILLTVLGVVSLCLGIAGIVLPVLPTTPFLLLSSFLFYKSSKRMHDWLENNRFFGQYIRNYRKYRAIKRRTKILSIILLWAALCVSAYFVDILWVRIALATVGIGVTVHLLRIKTLEKVLEEADKSDIKDDFSAG